VQSGVPESAGGTKGFDFAGAWTVCEQNRLLSVCFGFPQVHKA
jgi:transposase, IS6 family